MGHRQVAVVVRSLVAGRRLNRSCWLISGLAAGQHRGQLEDQGLYRRASGDLGREAPPRKLVRR